MKTKCMNVILTLVLFILSLISFGQDTLSDSSNSPYSESVNSEDDSFPEPPETSEDIAFPMTRYEYKLSLYVLSFGILVILLEIYLISNKNISSGDTIKFVIITIIIVSTLFLITAGYDNDQIAPAVGLLGTIAGYLLGRINSSKRNDNENN